MTKQPPEPPSARAASGPGRSRRANGSGSPRAQKKPVGIGSAELAMGVLDALLRTAGPTSLTELSDLTRMAPSKLHRYLVSLRRGGMISQHDGTGLYDLGPAALRLGLSALSRFDGVDIVNDGVRALSSTLGLSTFVYIWTEFGPILMRNHTVSYSAVTLRIGSGVPLVSSGTGPVFVAFLPEQVTAPIIERDARSEQLDLDKCTERLRDVICPKIRKDLVYWSEESILPNSSACAAPVFDGQRELFCVIGVGVPRRIQSAHLKKSVRDQVKAASAALSQELGLHA